MIEYVTEEILSDLIEDEEYVAVFFSGPECHTNGDGAEDGEGEDGDGVNGNGAEEDEDADDDDDDGGLPSCKKILRRLEEIDDEVGTVGIAFVQTDNEDYPFRVHAISDLPAVGLYRNGDFLQYPGEDLADGEEIRKWLMDEESLIIPGTVEEVNSDLLSYLYETNDNLVVFFYEETDREADDILDGLETIDDELDKENISLVQISEEDAGEPYGILDLPALVFVQSGIPNVYEEDDLLNSTMILDWISEEAKTNRIHDVNKIVLNKLTEKMENLAIIFYDMEEGKSLSYQT